ncbi:MAG: alpha/beta fold hydrolase [Methanobacterium sp.]
MDIIHESYIKSSLTSKDGTIIGYRQFGSGPGLILVHGGMAASQHLMKLGEELSDDFTVYIPDRRGRGLSGPFGDDYSIQREVDDLDAILNKTGAHYVFGLSSGALITLQAACNLPVIHKIALFEPALYIDHSLLEKFNKVMNRFDKEIAEGEIAAALVTVLKGLGIMPSMFNLLPRFLLVRIFTRALKNDFMKVKDDDVPLQLLVPTQHFDYQLLVETEGTLENFKAVQAGVLLMEGSKSPSFLKDTIDALCKVLPHAKRRELFGLDHAAPTNSGKPERVARELQRFFL